MERAAHQRKSERKQTTSSVGSVGLSPLVKGEVSQLGKQLPEHQEKWRQQPWPCSAMKERHKNKNQSIWPLRAWNIRPQPDNGNAFRCFRQYPVMQGSKEGKRNNLWGPRTHFGANIPMKIGPEYQCLKELGQNSNVYKKAPEFKCFEE